MSQYRFKPAPIRGVQEWQLQEGQISNGRSAPLTLDEVTSIQFVDSYANRLMNSVLTLKTDSAKINIVCNDRLHGQQRPEYLRLAEDVFTYLSGRAAAPDVTIGLPKIARLIIALSGIILAIFGAMIALSSREAAIMILGLGMGAVGVAIFFFYAPWRQPKTLTVDEALELIRSSNTGP